MSRRPRSEKTSTGNRLDQVLSLGRMAAGGPGYHLPEVGVKNIAMQGEADRALIAKRSNSYVPKNYIPYPILFIASELIDQWKESIRHLEGVRLSIEQHTKPRPVQSDEVDEDVIETADVVWPKIRGMDGGYLLGSSKEYIMGIVSSIRYITINLLFLESIFKEEMATTPGLPGLGRMPTESARFQMVQALQTQKQGYFDPRGKVIPWYLDDFQSNDTVKNALDVAKLALNGRIMYYIEKLDHALTEENYDQNKVASCVKELQTKMKKVYWPYENDPNEGAMEFLLNGV